MMTLSIEVEYFLVKEIFGFKVPVELIIGAIGILILLEATRRAIGLPLVIIAICFLLFSYFGKYAPDIISHGGLSVKRLVGFQWFDQEAIFGIPIGSISRFYIFICFIWSLVRNCRWWKIFFRFSLCYGWQNARRSS